MNDYRIRIRLLSSLGTPWQSDTVFGHIAWHVAHGAGDVSIDKFLQPFREGSPPFVLSDGFPDEYLPRPLLPIAPSGELTPASYALSQERRKTRFVSHADFDAIRRDPAAEWKPVADLWQRFETPHAAINRLTSTTSSVDAEGGGNFFTTDTVALAAGDLISLYLRAEGRWAQWVPEMLTEMAPLGFGRDRSVGAGAYEVVSTEPFDGFSDFAGANAFVSLSSYVPARMDPTDGYWRVRLKYGKLGEHGGHGNPFKRPLVQLEPGAVFRTQQPGGPYYGRVVQGIAPGLPEAIQCCYTISVPCLLPDEA